MEKFFRKYNWAINFVLIGVGALLAALMINSFVAATLADLTVPELPSFEDLEPADAEMRVDDTDRDQWADRLADRCLFGCPEAEEDPDECPEECPEGEVCEAGECVAEDPEIEDDELDLDVPRLTEKDVTLTGVLAAQNPRWSVAMIYSEADNKTHVVGVGDALPDDDPIEILEIRRDRIFIDNDGQLEFIRLEGSPYGDPQPIDPRERQRESGDDGAERDERRDRGGADDDDDDSGDGGDERTGVVEQGDGQFTVERDRIESELEDPDSLNEGARIMPNYTDGEADGLRLVGVRSGSLYSDLGIQSGDVLQSVDGDAISSQREALEMLEAMGQQDRVSIEIERRGQRQELQYNIR